MCSLRVWLCSDETVHKNSRWDLAWEAGVRCSRKRVTKSLRRAPEKPTPRLGSDSVSSVRLDGLQLFRGCGHFVCS